MNVPAYMSLEVCHNDLTEVIDHYLDEAKKASDECDWDYLTILTGKINQTVELAKQIFQLMEGMVEEHKYSWGDPEE